MVIPDRTLDGDMFLAQRIAFHANREPMELVSRVFAGDTTGTIRRERFRAAILDYRLASIIIGKRDGEPETYKQHFERRYQEPLEVPRGTSIDLHEMSEVTP